MSKFKSALAGRQYSIPNLPDQISNFKMNFELAAILNFNFLKLDIICHLFFGVWTLGSVSALAVQLNIEEK